MVRIFRTFVFILAALSVMVVAAPASGQTVTDCRTTIADLREDTSSATFVGQNQEKDQAGLVAKLESAAAKLEQGKTADALQALTQFRDKAAALAIQGKLDPAYAQTLIAGANDITACVQAPTA